MATGIDPVIPLGIVTLVGLGFTYLGYDLFDLFLSWVGGLLGAGIGGAIGWFVLGSGSGTDPGGQVVIAAVLALFGGLVGAGLISALARFAIVIAAFLASSLAGLLVFAGSRLLNLDAIPEGGIELSPEVLIETLFAVVRIDLILEGELQQSLLLTGVVGFTGAALAYKFYPVVIAAATSIFGAVLLGSVMPLWQAGVLGGAELTFQMDQTLNGWTGIALITGFVFQSYRNSEEIKAFVDTTFDVFS